MNTHNDRSTSLTSKEINFLRDVMRAISMQLKSDKKRDGILQVHLGGRNHALSVRLADSILDKYARLRKPTLSVESYTENDIDVASLTSQLIEIADCWDDLLNARIHPLVKQDTLCLECLDVLSDASFTKPKLVQVKSNIHEPRVAIEALHVLGFAKLALSALSKGLPRVIKICEEHDLVKPDTLRKLKALLDLVKAVKSLT